MCWIGAAERGTLLLPLVTSCCWLLQHPFASDQGASKTAVPQGAHDENQPTDLTHLAPPPNCLLPASQKKGHPDGRASAFATLKLTGPVTGPPSNAGANGGAVHRAGMRREGRSHGARPAAGRCQVPPAGHWTRPPPGPPPPSPSLGWSPTVPVRRKYDGTYELVAPCLMLLPNEASREGTPREPNPENGHFQGNLAWPAPALTPPPEFTADIPPWVVKRSLPEAGFQLPAVLSRYFGCILHFIY